MNQTDRTSPGRPSAGASRGVGSFIDRRRHLRHSVLDHRGWLGRWDDGDFEVVDVHLLDLGRGGVAFETDVRPSQDEASLLGLHALRESWCLEVRVVGIAWGRRRRYRVHAAFTGLCPDEFYAAAISGSVTGAVAGPGCGAASPRRTTAGRADA
jgi:hypothetical protein